MILYKNNTEQFREDVLSNNIADILAGAFKASMGYQVNSSEYRSWNNSCQHLKNLIDLSGLKDNMICLEYEVPYNTGRIDCLLFGRSEQEKGYVALLELKQWTKAAELDDEENFVETYTGGGTRKVPHPSQQIEGYYNHLVNFVQIFEIDENFELFSCAYCHNYNKEPGRGLFAERYQFLMEKFPVYTKEDVKKLAEKLRCLLAKGDGLEIFNRFMQSPIRPSKKLLENISSMIEKNKAVFSLLNEQLVAKNVILSKIRKAERLGQKSVVVVKGGPGTGKTVIALNILGELAKKNKKVFYGCKSKPFREALAKMVGPGSRLLFSNLTRFLPNHIGEDELDVVLVDEAHRIEKTSNSRYTKTEDRTNMPQVEQLVRCAKTAVFFIDDRQGVRHQEIGASGLIEEIADKYGAEHEIVQLLSQFRCAGSDNYLDWIEFVLGYSERPVDLTKDERFDFRIAGSPHELYGFIKAREDEKPNSARLVAGYCWPWSDPKPDGMLVDDVKIGDFAMPWEGKDGVRLAKGIPKWYQWAYTTRGVEQIGCIYTVQGFEFDYIGVIVGADIEYDRTKDKLRGNIAATCDPTLRRNPGEFATYVKNIYRVLMTRGMKGCYVYFCDKEVEAFFRKHIKGDADFTGGIKVSDIISKEDEKRFSIEKEVEEYLKFTEYLPVYSMEAACGYFGEGQPVEQEGWIKAAGLGRVARNMFVVRASGHSMEPKINDGDYCVFRLPIGGSRAEKIVLVQHNQISDPETGGKYTIKKYSSKKKYGKDGTWEHEEIVLSPVNISYEPIIIPVSEGEEFMVIGEFVRVI
ncbi:MAG: DNA/RNA helicase domain-containing protein [Candidatus Omnitrophota bacterium]